MSGQAPNNGGVRPGPNANPNPNPNSIQPGVNMEHVFRLLPASMRDSPMEDKMNFIRQLLARNSQKGGPAQVRNPAQMAPGQQQNMNGGGQGVVQGNQGQMQGNMGGGLPNQGMQQGQGMQQNQRQMPAPAVSIHPCYLGDGVDVVASCRCRICNSYR